ncbi:MAG TPA: alpha/beta hydrolase [Phycisphaerae bacterium]|nr:alpha/beta hydrolase [Phycisphaerae bacterium]
MSRERTLVLFTGLAADARLLEPQRELPYRLITPDWIEPQEDESLPAYARRMAAGADWPERVVLGGVSFGGMVATELASEVRPDGIVLIASARATRSIPSTFRFVNGLIRIVEDFDLGAGGGPGGGMGALRMFMNLFQDFDETAQALMAEMLAGTSPGMLHWASELVRVWDGAAAPACPVLHIHGADDPVLPIDRVTPDVVIPGGGHLVNWTHAREVNQAVRRFVDGLPG